MKSLKIISVLIILLVSILFATYLTIIASSNYFIKKGKIYSETLEILKKKKEPSNILNKYKDMAENYFSIGLKLNSENGWGHYLYAKFLFYNVLLQQALDEYLRCFKTFDNIDLYKEVGITYYYLKKPQKAIEYLKKYLKLIDGDYIAYQMMGHCYFSLRKYKTAILYYSKAVDLKEDAQIYNRIGVCLSYLGRFEEAVDPFEKVVDIDPNFAPVYKNLAALYGYRLKNKDYKKAYEAYQRYLLLNPYDPENKIILGRIQYLKYRYKCFLRKSKSRKKH